MIVGVDHLTFEVRDLHAGIKSFEVLAFNRVFTVQGLANDASKRPYLRRWGTLHDISLLRPRKEGVAVELVCHASQAANAEVVHSAVVLAGEAVALEAREWSDRGRCAVAGAFGLAAPECVVSGQLERLHGPVLWLTEGAEGNQESPRTIGAALLVVNLRESIDFWTRQLGMRLERESPSHGLCGWARLEMPSPVPAWRLTVVLVEDSETARAPRSLDALGLTSVCLISTDIGADVERLAACPGAGFGRPFRIDIAGRSLRVCMGHGPSGELIELLQVETPPGRAATRLEPT